MFTINTYAFNVYSIYIYILHIYVYIINVTDKSHDVPPFNSWLKLGVLLPFSLWRPRVPAAMARTAAALLAALALQWTGVDAYARLATAAAGTKRRG